MEAEKCEKERGIVRCRKLSRLTLFSVAKDRR